MATNLQGQRSLHENESNSKRTIAPATYIHLFIYTNILTIRYIYTYAANVCIINVAHFTQIEIIASVINVLMLCAWSGHTYRETHARKSTNQTACKRINERMKERTNKELHTNSTHKLCYVFFQSRRHLELIQIYFIVDAHYVTEKRRQYTYPNPHFGIAFILCTVESV